MSIIFVPTKFKDRILQSCPVAECISEEIWGECRKIPLKGYLFSLPKKTQVGVTFGFQNVYDSFLTELKEQSAVCVIPLTKEERDSLKSKFNLKLHGLGTDAADINPFFELVIKMEKFIAPIMMATQYKITLHLCGTDVFEPYYEDNHLHIVVGSAPPGYTTEQKLSDAFFLGMLHDSKNGLYPAATKCRGTEVTLEDVCLGQVVGSTLYVFVPFCRDIIEVHVLNECKLFQENLAEVWRAFCDTEFYQPVSEKPLDEESFSAILTDSTLESKLKTLWHDEIKKLQLKIESQQKALAVTMAELRSKIVILKQSQGVDLESSSSSAEWAEISVHPLIDRIVEIDGQIIYFTRNILIEDEAGGWRDTGSFAIIVNLVNVVIWSTRMTHPKRISHPHIGEESAICFGNIATEVAKLCAEGRQVAVALLVLRWLSEGYEPSLTLHPIEEWPLAAVQDVPHCHLSNSGTSLIKNRRVV